MKNTEQPLKNAKRKKQAYRFLQGVMLLAYALFAGSWIYTFTVFPELNGRALSQAERTAISRVGSIRGFGEWAVYLSFFGICVLVCTQKKSFLEEIAAIGKSFLLLGLACAACSSGYYLAVGSTVWNFTEPLFFSGAIGILVLCVWRWWAAVRMVAARRLFAGRKG